MKGGFPGGSAVKNLPAVQETQFNPSVGKIPWRRAWHSSTLAYLENPMDTGAWHLQSTESDTTEAPKQQQALKDTSNNVCKLTATS